MSKVKIIKDNAILSVEEEDLAQYEARGYKKLKKETKPKGEDKSKETKPKGK